MSATSWIVVLLSTVGAALFLVVGRTIQQRHVSREARSAQMAFVTWWYGLAAVSITGTLLSLPGFPRDLSLFLGVTLVLLAVLCAALAGLLHYLVFLYTNRNLLPALALGYTAFFVLLVAFILMGQPDGFEETPRGVQLHYAEPIDSGPFYVLVISLLLVPPVAASLAYLSLYWKTQDPMLRRRILLVSLSIAVWFGSSVVGLAPGAESTVWWTLTSQVISLAAAATILYAYRGLRPSKPQGTGSRAADSDERLYEEPTQRLSSVRSIA